MESEQPGVTRRVSDAMMASLRTVLNGEPDYADLKDTIDSAGVEYINPIGDLLAELHFGDQTIEIIAPKITDMPVGDGPHIQVIDRSLNVDKLQDTPYMSDNLDIQKYLRLEAVAALVGRRMYQEYPEAVWINLNTRTAPNLNPNRSSDAYPQQYYCLMADIHCKKLPRKEDIF